MFDARNFGLFYLFALDSLSAWVYRAQKGILFTNDGGVSWDSTSISRSYDFGGGPLHFFDKDTGFVFSPYLSKTVDGGHSWIVENYEDTDITAGAYIVKFVDQNKGWLAGAPTCTDAGMIAATTNSGMSWGFQLPCTSPIFTGLDFVDSLNGFAIGFNAFGLNAFGGGGNILRTTNGGLNWLRQDVGGGLGWFPDIGFYDKLRGWATGSYGRIWETTDGGVSWNLQQTNVTVNLPKISVLRSENIVYVFGDSSVILRRDAIVGVTEESHVPPPSSSLLQNYPNPFNPETRIEYSLAEHARVSLEIYDVLGRIVTTLVEGEQEAGTHSAILDANTLPGGIYFYRLKAGTFKDVKKMLLVK